MAEVKKNCWEDEVVEDIGLCPQEDVDAGIAEEIYYAPAEHIKSIPAPAAATDHASYVTIAEPIVMETGKGFAKMKLQVDLNGLKAALVGNKGNKKVQTTLEAFIAGFKAQLVGFQEKYKNARLVFAIPDGNGNTWLIGDKLKPARFENFDLDTGKTNEDNNGATLNIVANKGPRLYTAELPMANAAVVPPVGG